MLPLSVLADFGANLADLLFLLALVLALKGSLGSLIRLLFDDPADEEEESGKGESSSLLFKFGLEPESAKSGGVIMNLGFFPILSILT